MAKVFNPIYDTVFKYLMEDKRVAKVLLSGILSKNIIDVAIKSHEHIVHRGDDLQLLRIDFAATIENLDGTKETATIELQKASEPEEVMRFRRYFGIQMASDDNADAIIKHHRDKDKTPYQILKPRHIYGIFILGHSLGKDYEYPLIKGRTVFTDEDDNVLNFRTKSEFINGMTYDLYIIQIPHLPERPKRPLEKMLRAFDQRYKVEGNAKFVDLNEDEDDSSDFNIILRRLFHATVNEQLRGDLDYEDSLIRQALWEKAEREELEYELKEKRKEIEASKKEIEASKKEIEAGKKQIEASKKEIEDSKKQIEASKKEIEAKDKEIEAKGSQLAASIKMLSSLGVDHTQIAKSLKISIEEVNKVLQ